MSHNLDLYYARNLFNLKKVFKRKNFILNLFFYILLLINNDVLFYKKQTVINSLIDLTFTFYPSIINNYLLDNFITNLILLKYEILLQNSKNLLISLT